MFVSYLRLMWLFSDVTSGIEPWSTVGKLYYLFDYYNSQVHRYGEKHFCGKICAFASQASLLAWTTTPWTLPSNLALCVNPDFDYVKLRWGLRNGRLYSAVISSSATFFPRNHYIIQHNANPVELGKKCIDFRYFNKHRNCFS